MARKTKDVRFEIVTCCGDHLKYVTMQIPRFSDPVEFESLAIKKAGYHQHECGGCYDNAYHCRWEEL